MWWHPKEYYDFMDEIHQVAVKDGPGPTSNEARLAVRKLFKRLIKKYSTQEIQNKDGLPFSMITEFCWTYEEDVIDVVQDVLMKMHGIKYKPNPKPAWMKTRDDQSSAIDELQSMPYSEYLKTEHWQKKRIEALDYADKRCQICNSNQRLDVHHRTYERRGCERLSDLTVLCRGCHSKHHGKSSRDGGRS